MNVLRVNGGRQQERCCSRRVVSGAPACSSPTVLVCGGVLRACVSAGAPSFPRRLPAPSRSFRRPRAPSPVPRPRVSCSARAEPSGSETRVLQAKTNRNHKNACARKSETILMFACCCDPAGRERLLIGRKKSQSRDVTCTAAPAQCSASAPVTLGARVCLLATPVRLPEPSSALSLPPLSTRSRVRTITSGKPVARASPHSNLIPLTHCPCTNSQA